MPFTHTCEDCGETGFGGLDDLRTHQRETGHTHGRTDFRQHPGSRRTWSCARCAGQVPREDDGSMLCDTCLAEGPLPRARLLPRGEASPGGWRHE